MKGDEVLTDADILVTGNRIAAVGAAGTLSPPAGTRELRRARQDDHSGTHRHARAPALLGLRDLPGHQVGVRRQPGLRRDDGLRPLGAVARRLRAGRRWSRPGSCSGRASTPPATSSTAASRRTSSRRSTTSTTPRRQVRRMKAYGARMIKVYQQPRRSQRMWFAEACRDEHMLLTAEGAGELQTDMTMVLDGFTAFEHALPVELAGRHRQLRREVRHLLHADADRRVRRTVGRGVLLADAQSARRREAQSLHAARRSSTRRRAAPVDLSVRVQLPDGRDRRGRRAARRRQRVARRARAGAGPRPALGALGDGGRGRAAKGCGDDADGGAARLHDPRGRQDRLRAGPRLDRGGQARRPRRARRRPAGRHPQHRRRFGGSSRTARCGTARR